jgi:putative Ca2+/H+ antiporter (TMEM165/GDT1 family)
MNVLPKLQTEFDPYVTNQSFVGVVSRFIGVPFNTSIITIGEVIIFLIFAVITIHYGKKNTREVELLWLLTILLSAGKNSYWNMTPAIFIYLYFFKLNTPIEVKSRFVLAVSAVLNILFPYFILAFTKYPTLLSTVGGKICSSLGFFSLLILYYPLMKNIHFK